MVALGVRHRRLEQLAPVARDLTRSEGEDSACLLDGLSAQVPAHHPRLAGGGPHVAGVSANDPAPRALWARLPRAAAFLAASRSSWAFASSRLSASPGAAAFAARLSCGAFCWRTPRGALLALLGLILSAAFFGGLSRRPAFSQRRASSGRGFFLGRASSRRRLFSRGRFRGRAFSPLRRFWRRAFWPRPWASVGACPRRSVGRLGAHLPDLPRAGVSAEDARGRNSPSL